MFDTVMNIIRKSDAVVVSVVRRSEIVTVDGHEYLRVETEVDEAFKIPASTREKLTIDVRTAGKETPDLEVNRRYLFFLKSPEGVDPPPWRLVDMTRPAPVPDSQRDAFLRCTSETVQIAATSPKESAVKQHVFKMLRSGASYFQSDATRVALDISRWTEKEIDRLIAILLGDKDEPPPGGNERDNLVTVVVQHGKPQRAASFARLEMKKEGSDPIFYGLFKRNDRSVDKIVWELLDDSEPAVQIAAIRVVGLLRRVDILDAFEKKYGGTADPNIHTALQNARNLANRDY